ncbi:MAG: ATP-dependent sacrificial sulfur transferase LarE [Candidatus Kariarchaeaceae archaeon]|jgi:uncharacterized protein
MKVNILTQLELVDEKIIKNKLAEIASLLKNKKVLVSFSGGVDSSVIAWISKQYAKETILVMQIGNSVGIGEKEIALEQAEQMQLSLQFIEYEEIDHSKEYAANPHNRCFYCKEILYDYLEKIRKEYGFDVIINGTNFTDLQGHRPGHEAALKSGVLTPFVHSKITKPEIRWIAKDASLLTWDKAASACLASRFPTGTIITKEGLQRVAKAEYYLKSQFGFRKFRVRDHNRLARIELDSDEFQSVLDQKKMDQITLEFKKLGYNFVTLDLEGYRKAVPVI